MHDRKIGGLLALISIVSVLHCATKASAAWPTIDWHVACYVPPDLSAWSGSQAPAATSSSDYQTYVATVASFDEDGSCDDAKPQSHAYQVREQLVAASRWLSDQGFPQPNIPLSRSRNALEAFIVVPGATYCFNGACVQDGTRSAYMFTGSRTPAENARDPNRLFVVPGSITLNWTDVAHELFHAIQHAFPDFDAARAPDWIVEGTAQAVGLTWASRSSGSAPLSERKYSERLHRNSTQTASYDDEAFWRAAARDLNSESSYAFLIPILSANPAGDGLAAAYAGLTAQGGLAEVYANVIARQLRDVRFFAPVGRVTIRPDEKIERQVQVEPVATTALIVQPDVPSGRAELTISIPGSTEAYRLIVNGARLDQHGGAERNRVVLEVTDSLAEVFVQTVNVAARADAAAPASIPLEFELRDIETWVTLNSETFEPTLSICNSQGVVALPVPETRSIGFTIRAPGGTTRVAWGEASVSATLFARGCSLSSFPPCQNDGAWYAGGARPSNRTPARFNVSMRYDVEQGSWTGAGTLQSDQQGLAPVAFSIQCRASDRRLIR